LPAPSFTWAQSSDTTPLHTDPVSDGAEKHDTLLELLLDDTPPPEEELILEYGEELPE
jgi:hypothetical protein